MVQAHAPFPPASSEAINRWSAYAERSRYFLVAVLLHLVVLFLVATLVIFPAFHPPLEPVKNPVFVPPASHPVQPPTTVTPPQDLNVATMSDLPNTPDTPIVVRGSDRSFTVVIPRVNDVHGPVGGQRTPPHLTIRPNQPSLERTRMIETTVMGWTSKDEIFRSPGDIKGRHADFAIYLAKYADGDWDCNTILHDNKIVGGSLMNLAEKISEWSHGRLTGTVVPEPLDIASPELVDKPPPFIFFTGHKDFQLTEKEIENLRQYLLIGGCIWGDSALAGQGSRFDVAFHREMKRVVPDPNLNFQATTMADPIFTKSWYPMDKLPSGMNDYAEPIQHLDIDGRLAILYTPNDYADMLTMHILPGDKQMGPDWVPDDATSFLQTDGTFLHHNGIFFRNYGLAPCLACQQLGMNVVGYLLVRFDDLFLLNPP